MVGIGVVAVITADRDETDHQVSYTWKHDYYVPFPLQ